MKQDFKVAHNESTLSRDDLEIAFLKHFFEDTA